MRSVLRIFSSIGALMCAVVAAVSVPQLDAPFETPPAVRAADPAPAGRGANPHRHRLSLAFAS